MKTKPKQDYKSIFKQNPFIYNQKTRETQIKCPSCASGFLEIRYNKDGGNFICPACKFVLP